MVFKAFLRILHQEMTAWEPKKKFLFHQCFNELFIRSVDKLGRSVERGGITLPPGTGINLPPGTLPPSFPPVPETESSLPPVSPPLPPVSPPLPPVPPPEIYYESDCVSLSQRGDIYKFEWGFGSINFFKNGEKKDSFDVSAFEEEMELMWNRHQSTRHHSNKGEALKQEIRKLVDRWISLGIVKTGPEMKDILDHEYKRVEAWEEVKRKETEIEVLKRDEKKGGGSKKKKK